MLVEELAGENRAQRQQDERHQDRPRAFVRVIAGGAFLAFTSWSWALS